MNATAAVRTPLYELGDLIKPECRAPRQNRRKSGVVEDGARGLEAATSSVIERRSATRCRGGK
jgi:hypothetical protein